MSGLRRGFAFGSYIVDPVRRLVWYDGKLLPVTGKAFELLVFLLDHRDRVLEKDELLKAVWPGTFVQENNLVRHISTLRKALGQRADQHDCILTVQSRGYQFVAQVTELDSLPSDLPTTDGEQAGFIVPNGSGDLVTAAVTSEPLAPPGPEASSFEVAPVVLAARPSVNRLRRALVLAAGIVIVAA